MVRLRFAVLTESRSILIDIVTSQTIIVCIVFSAQLVVMGSNETRNRETTMKFAKINVYRDGDVWCHATWIDEEFDCSDPLGIPDDATEAEAMDAARAMLSGRVKRHEVNRIDDVA